MYNQHPQQYYGQTGYPSAPTMNMPPAPHGIPVQWMQRPAPIHGCPPGLEYLSQIQQVLVQQKVDLLEAFTGWDENNRYVIRNAQGQQIYYAFEKTDTCMRVCCASDRGFTIHIVDNFNKECLRISREFKCCAGHKWCASCCDCCAHEVKVETPGGNVLGYVKQKGSFWIPKFIILDAHGNPIMEIKGPCLIMNGAFMPCDNEFEINLLKTNAPIGRITKQYAGFAKEMFTNADNFMIEFPVDLAINYKATLLGALFLIDFMFFEHQDDQTHQGHNSHRY